jgi:hypothetical protein
MMSLSLIVIVLGIGGCLLGIVAVIAVVWAVTHDRPPSSGG